jgi:hypothetical protein
MVACTGIILGSSLLPKDSKYVRKHQDWFPIIIYLKTITRPIHTVNWTCIS